MRPARARSCEQNEKTGKNGVGKKRGQTRFIQMQMGTGVVLLPWSARGKYGVRHDLTIAADIGPDVPLLANASAP